MSGCRRPGGGGRDRDPLRGCGCCARDPAASDPGWNPGRSGLRGGGRRAVARPFPVAPDSAPGSRGVEEKSCGRRGGGGRPPARRGACGLPVRGPCWSHGRSGQGVGAPGCAPWSSGVEARNCGHPGDGGRLVSRDLVRGVSGPLALSPCWSRGPPQVVSPSPIA